MSERTAPTPEIRLAESEICSQHEAISVTTSQNTAFCVLDAMKTLLQFTVLISCAAMLAMPCSASGASPPAHPANIVLILADDLGYECIGANGGTSYKTPVLDKLATTGVRFDQCYAQPLCTPTRVQLMTGIYNVRNYIKFGVLDPQATTFAHILKSSGYATCIAGKWQLGEDVDLPRKAGFDEYYLWDHFRHPSRYKNPGLEINGVSKDWTNGEYGPDIISDYALDFMQRKKSASFFLYYTMMLTHGPYDPTPESSDYATGGKEKKRNEVSPHFRDMVEHMDMLVGKLLKRLDELGLRENTLVLFLGDNGTGAGTVSMMGDRKIIGGKGATTDTGMHVPFIANWPGKIPGGRVLKDLVDSTDFLPTLCAAAGAPVPAALKLDGRSFLPQLFGERGQPREWIYSWYSRQGVLAEAREFAANQQFKLYRTGEFYDLGRDRDEKQPLDVPSLEGDAAAAARRLKHVLESYKDARPASLNRVAKKNSKPEPE